MTSAAATTPGSEAPAAGPPAVNPWLVAISVMAATFMEVLDTTVVNVSLPHIAGTLSSTNEEATWALTSYLVANAIVLPMTGWLARQFGRKRLLLASVTGFTVASFLCGFAPNLPFLIFCRIVQGATGGGLQPLSQSILLEVFPPRERGKAMAFWSIGIVVAPMLGPVLGGFLTDNYSWRWVFYINIPIGLLALAMTWLFVHDPAYLKKDAGRIDWWGIGLLVVGIGALQIMLDKGQQEDWFASRFIVTLAVLTVVGLCLLVYRELSVENPIVDLRVFKDRSFATGTFVMTVLGFVLYGSTVLMPLLMQTLLGYSAFQAGVALMPRGLASFCMMPIIGILIGRMQPRRVLVAGVVLCSLSFYLISGLSLSAGRHDFLLPLVVQGMSMGMLFIPLTMLTNDSIPREKLGNATSVFNLLRNIGGSVGIASVTTMLARRVQVHTNELGALVDPFRPEVQAQIEGIRRTLIAAGSDPVAAAQQALAIMAARVQQQAAMMTYNDIFMMMTIMFATMIVFVPIMRRPTHGAGMPAAH